MEQSLAKKAGICLLIAMAALGFTFFQMSSLPPRSEPPIPVIVAIGAFIVSWYASFYFFARAKGYSGIVGMLALLGPIGILILLVLPLKRA